MIEQLNKKIESNTKRGSKLTNDLIIIFILLLSLFFQSIATILSIFRKGILKKQLLSKDSKLGFDLIIRKTRKAKK